MCCGGVLSRLWVIEWIVECVLGGEVSCGGGGVLCGEMCIRRCCMYWEVLYVLGGVVCRSGVLYIGRCSVYWAHFIKI